MVVGKNDPKRSTKDDKYQRQRTDSTEKPIEKMTKVILEKSDAVQSEFFNEVGCAWKWRADDVSRFVGIVHVRIHRRIFFIIFFDELVSLEEER